MSELKLSAKWMAAASGDPEVRATAAWLDMAIDGVSLTRHQDIWAETVRDNVLLSAYPLAMWLVGSWWRLNHEPLPMQRPGHSWRMTHELGAANHGYVWPRVIFAPEGEAIQVWAGSLQTPDQSVQYLQGLDVPRSLDLTKFQLNVQTFVRSVIARLDAKELADTDLANLWTILLEDLGDPEATRRRKLEAELGFDPEECPEALLNTALAWECSVGNTALSELAPAIGYQDGTPDLQTFERLVDARGMVGTPQVATANIDHAEQGLPWERAVHDARALRKVIGEPVDPISSPKLYQLLGLSNSAASKSLAVGKQAPVAVAMPTKSGQMKFVPRKRNAAGQRFEIARFLGEYLRPSNDKDRWLVSTDLSTSRQKYQRAFAAEFLCPIESLTAFLDEDYSSYAIDEAAEKFEVSEVTVRSLLQNNGYIYPVNSGNLPYQMAT